MEFITRDYNSITLNANKGTIVKTSQEKRLEDESLYYEAIPKRLSNYFPRLIQRSDKEGVYFMELEYLPFENLGKLWFQNKLDNQMWENVCDYLKTALAAFSSVSYQPFNRGECRSDMLVGKTEREYNALVGGFDFFRNLDQFATVTLNGKEYLNFPGLWQGFLKDHVLDNYCSDEQLTFMHGDMCFSNILCGYDDNKNVVLKFIDPRGSFGTKGCLGDVYYDLAKLMHSIDGKYEAFIYDRFEVEALDPSTFWLTYHDYELQPLTELFSDRLFSDYDETKIKVIQGLIYIGMCARHYDSHDRQLAMYLTGVRILNECMEKIYA